MAVSIEKSVIQTIVSSYNLAKGREGKDPSRRHAAITAAEQYLNAIDGQFLEDQQIVDLVMCFLSHPTKNKHPSDNVFLKILRVIRKITTNNQLPVERSTLESLRDLLRNAKMLDVSYFEEIIRSTVTGDHPHTKNSFVSPPIIDPGLIDFPHELSQKDREIQEHKTQIMQLEQQLNLYYSLFSRAQTLLQSKTMQAKTLEEILRAQEGSLVQQQEFIQKQKALLERLADDCNKLATQGLQIMGQFTVSLGETRDHFSERLSTPKKTAENKDSFSQADMHADEQLLLDSSFVFDSVKTSCLKLDPLIKEFTATTESQSLDILDTLVYPAIEPRILPDNGIEKLEEEQAIAEILNVRLDHHAFAGDLISALPLAAAPAPPPPPPPPAAPPPPPPFDPGKFKSGRLSKNSNGLVNKLAATEQKKNDKEDQVKGLAITDQSVLQNQLSRLKKTDGQKVVNEKRSSPAINPVQQALLDRVAANRAQREAREAKAKNSESVPSPQRKAQKAKIVDLVDTLHEGLSKLTAANYCQDDSWSQEGSSFNF